MRLKIETKQGQSVQIAVAENDALKRVEMRLDRDQVQRLIDLLQMALKAKNLSLELDV